MIKALAPPKEKRAPAKSALKSAEQLAGYVTSSVLQACRSMNRHCVACGAHVPKANFSGYDGKGALSGPSMARIVARPRAKEERLLFGFVNEISLGPKKRAGAATHRICNQTVAKLKTGELS
jgi:hypothetical protein